MMFILFPGEYFTLPPSYSLSVPFWFPHFLQESILSLLWRLPQVLLPNFSLPVHSLFPHSHLNIFIIYPTDAFKFYPPRTSPPVHNWLPQFTPWSAFPLLQIISDFTPDFSLTCPWPKSTSFLPQNIHFLPWRFPQVLPICPQQFYLRVFLFFLRDNLTFYPLNFPNTNYLLFLPQNIHSFTHRLTQTLLPKCLFCPLYTN